MTGYTCSSCGFSVWRPLKELRVAWLGFYDDSRFPGRCLVVLKEHVEHFSELDAETALQFMLDCQDAARAIREATAAERINYAILGNTEPHLHMHLIPRHANDPVPKRTPWEHPERRSELEPEDAEQVMASILEHWSQS